MTRTMVTSVEEAVTRIQETFWAHYNRNERLREALSGKDRRILLDVLDDETYHVIVEDGRITQAAPGPIEDPDVRVESTLEDLLALLNGDLHPIKAYFSRRVRVHAPVRDLFLVKGFL